MTILTTKLTIPSKVGNHRVCQTSDLHLGRKISDFNRVNPLTGQYCQWDDQVDALRKTTALILEKNPAIAIYPGDIFDRPSNISEKLLAAFQESLLSLIKNDIGVLIFTGNHDFPKSREYKALISRYDGIGEYLNVVSVYKAQYEKININDEILIHCIPQCFSKDQFKEELDKVERDPNFKVNILTTHIGVQGAGIAEYEHAEAWLNKLELELDFDYIALGDYHRPLKVSDKCAYAGVLCKGNFGDREAKHGIITFDGDTNEIEFSEYEVRGMEQYNIDCLNLDVNQIDDKLAEIGSSFDKEKYVKIELENISKLKQRQLDFKHIHTIKKEAYYCKISYVYLKEAISKEEKAVKDSTIKPIPEEFKSQLTNLLHNEEDEKRLFDVYTKLIKKDS